MIDFLQPRLSRLVRPLALAVAALMIGACGSPDDPSGQPVEIHFADYLGPQRRQVSTVDILPGRKEDRDRVGFGWSARRWRRGRPTVLEMQSETARIWLFSAAAEARGLEIEAYSSGRGDEDATPISLHLNGRQLTDIEPRDSWQSYRADIPARVVRQGANLLEFRSADADPSSQGQQGSIPSFRLRRLRVDTAHERLPWKERPAEITLLDGSRGKGARPVIQMPTDSYLDLVAELPRRSRLVGHYAVDFPVEGEAEEVGIYVELLDGRGRSRQLLAEKLAEPVVEPRRLVVDLARWSGDLARLRLRIEGPGRALVQWHDPRIVGRAGAGGNAFEGNEAASRPPRSGRLGRPDVIFILLDAARADAFSCFGGPYPTPACERLAREGTRFSHALAPSSWTGQSVPGILTGHYPDTLGIHHWGHRLPPTVPTLAELLQESGYDTFLWSQHPFYGWREDLQRGYESVRLELSRVVDNAELKRWLGKGPNPIFALIHLMPPHAPYEPPAPYRGLHSSWYQGEISAAAEFLNEFPHLRAPEELEADDLRYIKDRYLEHAVFADSQVGEVLEVLAALDRYEDALIVVLSDHGEAFLEHGFFLHARALYEEFLHVPLLVKWPRGAVASTSSVDEPVSLVDLVPTMVDGLDLPTDRGFQGISLLPVVFDEARPRRPLFSITRGVDLPKKPPVASSMLMLDGWKVIDNITTFQSELYNLTDDPGEQRDLAAEMPLKTLLLRQELERRTWLNQLFLERGGGEIDLKTLEPEAIEQLRALGYLN